MPKGVYVRTHIVPKKDYPLPMVAAVRRLYNDEGMTIAEVASALETTPKVVYRLMRNHGIERRVAAKRDQTGPANHAWRGQSAKYAALHLRVVTHRGKPSLCSWCGTTEGRFEWANISGRYEDVSDYDRLCVGCHRTYDAQRRQATGRSTIPERLR